MDERESDMARGGVETIKRLILLQLGRVESAKTLDEVKKITQDLAGAFQD